MTNETKRFLVLAEFKNGEEKELETNFYKKAFRQYDAWSRIETLSSVRMIDMNSERIGDMFSFTNR